MDKKITIKDLDMLLDGLKKLEENPMDANDNPIMDAFVAGMRKRNLKSEDVPELIAEKMQQFQSRREARREDIIILRAKIVQLRRTSETDGFIKDITEYLDAS